MTLFWLDLLGVPNHLLSTDVDDDAAGRSPHRPAIWQGRTMLVRKTAVVPIECVVRGYLAGSGWKEYQASGTVCGIPLPAGLQRERAAARADLHAGDQGGDRARRQHLVRADGRRSSGRTLAEELRRPQPRRLPPGGRVRREPRHHHRRHEVRMGPAADGELILIDEVLTPDSSRFWPADAYQPGGSPPSFDKQFVRDWLETTGWDKNSPPPHAAGRGGREDGGEVSGSARAADGVTASRPLKSSH